METNMRKPDNNLVWAILSTVVCCMPLGIVAIVKAALVDSLWAAGRYDEARRAAADALKWSLVGACIVMAVLMHYLWSFVISLLAGLASGLASGL